MFGLNPVTLYFIAFLIFTNLVSAFAWQWNKAEAQKQREAVAVCAAKFDSFKQQVEVLGKQQEQKVAEVIATANTITKDTEKRYEDRLAVLRADYDRLRKQYTQRGAGGGQVSALPVPASRVDEIPADALPLAERCAETTLMLVELQEWTEQQHKAKEN